MQISNLRSGKGFVYSLDAIVATILVVTVILTFNLAFESKLNPSSVILRTAATDAINVLNEKRTFYDLDSVIIETEIKKVLPENYKLNYRIKTKEGVVEGGGDLDKEDYYSGAGIVLVRGGLGIITYNIWQKE